MRGVVLAILASYFISVTFADLCQVLARDLYFFILVGKKLSFRASKSCQAKDTLL